VDRVIPTALKPGAEFVGRVHLATPARLDGTLEGEVTAVGQLWIGPTACIRARVHAPEIIIEGRIEGELHATRRLELLSTARVIADLVTPSLSLHEGAVLQGQCRAGDSSQSP